MCPGRNAVMEKKDSIIMRRVAVPFVLIILLMIIICGILITADVSENTYVKLFSNLLAIFMGIDGISIGYLCSAIDKSRYKTQEAINSNRTLLFSLNLLTSVLVLKTIAYIFLHFAEDYAPWIRSMLSSISAVLIIITLVFPLFYLADAAREIPMPVDDKEKTDDKQL